MKMKKNIFLLVVIALVFGMGIFVGCSGNANSDVSANETTAEEPKLAEGAKPLEGMKVYFVTPSTGFAADEETIAALEEVTTEERAPFLRIAHNGQESVDEVSGVTFVHEADLTPTTTGVVIYSLRGLSVEEIQNLYQDEYKKNVGEFESAYGTCVIMSK